MKIGIDVSSAVNQTAGIGRYTGELVAKLLEMDGRNEYVLHSFFGDASDLAARLGLPLSRIYVHGFNGRALRSYLLGLKLIGRTPNHLIRKVDLFHVPDFSFPAPKGIPSVLTVHDLIFLRYPEYFTWANRTFMRQIAKFSAHNASAVIADSYSSKQDIIEYLSIPEDKISVIHLAAGSQYVPAARQQIDTVLGGLGITEPYLLYVGTMEPRKNIATLLKAFSYCIGSMRDFPYRLVIAGSKGWLYDDIFKLVEELKLNEKIIFLGFIEDNILPALYSGAEAFLYPSIYEGFGLPVLEAMACGTPVVCSDVSSLPEVAGDAALLFGPRDVEQLAAHILSVIENSQLRSSMIEKGLVNAERFSWEKTASDTLQVYERLG